MFAFTISEYCVATFLGMGMAICQVLSTMYIGSCDITKANSNVTTCLQILFSGGLSSIERQSCYYYYYTKLHEVPVWTVFPELLQRF